MEDTMFESKTTLKVADNQYNRFVVDGVVVEFTPVYENGDYVGMMFSMTDVNETKPFLAKQLYFSKDFEFKTKVRRRSYAMNIGLKGSLNENCCSVITLVTRRIMQCGEASYRW